MTVAARKVLLVYSSEASYALKTSTFRRNVYPTLLRMGYQVDSITVSDTNNTIGDIIQDVGYEFAVMPNVSTFHPTNQMLNLVNGDYCPLFIPGLVDDGSFLFQNFGCDRTGSPIYRLGTFDGIGDLPVWSALYQAPASDTTRTREVLASDSTGKFILWRLTEGTHPVYCAAAHSTASNWLIVQMQYAVNAGSISAPPKRLCCTIDIDDCPTDAGTGMNLADFNALVADLNTYSLKTSMGIHASPTIGSRNEIEDVWKVNGVLDVIIENQVSNGGCIYPMEHQGLTWWSVAEINGLPSGGQTKTDIDTFYRSHIANMIANGLKQGSDEDNLDSWGYHYFNTNRIDKGGIELASRIETKLADPAEITKQLGYGWKVARCDSLYPDGNPSANSYHSKSGQYYCGVLLVESTSPLDSTDEILDPTLATSTDYASAFDSYLNSGVLMQPTYIHGSNAAAYVTEANCIAKNYIEYIGKVTTFCSDIIYCGHPSEYALLSGSN